MKHFISKIIYNSYIVIGGVVFSPKEAGFCSLNKGDVINGSGRHPHRRIIATNFIVFASFNQVISGTLDPFAGRRKQTKLRMIVSID